MIAVIDYGAGNLQSVKNALDFIRVKNRITNKAEDIEKADKIILPGVGSFGDTLSCLKKDGLIDAIKDSIEAGKPYLGICLGLQILFEKSEESKGVKGLGIFKGDVVRFRGKSLKIPQIGWNSVNITKKTPLTAAIKGSSYFYFVHSYYVKPKDSSIIMAKTYYGTGFVSGIAKDSIYGVQFHPERSGSVGLELLKNFCRLR